MAENTSEGSKGSAARHERVYAILRTDILEGRYAGGEKLGEAEIAQRFKVSRTPVREALRKLERDGLVKRTVNVGVVVTKTTTDSIQQYLQVLQLLETFAAETWAGSAHVAADLPYLTNLQDGMKKAFADKDVALFEQLNRQFHARFLERSDNAYLRALVVETRQKMFSMALESFPSALHIEQYLADHDRILDEARRGDPGKVAEAMRSHLRNIGANISRA